MTDLSTLPDAAVDYLTAVAIERAEAHLAVGRGNTRIAVATPSGSDNGLAVFRPTAGGGDGAEVLDWLWRQEFSMCLVAEYDETSGAYYKGEYVPGAHGPFDFSLNEAERFPAPTPWRALCLATIAHALHTGTLTDAQVAEAVRLAGGEG